MDMRLQTPRSNPKMIFIEDQAVHIPTSLVDLESFTRWTDSKEFPDDGRICYLDGEVWVDMTREQLFTHLQVKAQFNFILVGLAEAEGHGLYFPDGLRLSNAHANFSVVPDGVYVSHGTLRSGRARLIKGVRGGYVELQGSPDLVLENVSSSSTKKDSVRLRRAYWQAGISEYWLVDARKEPSTFDILRHGARGYVASRKQGAWVKSGILGKAFRLTRKTDALGYPKFTLSVR
jgi:Uma2 family endonuclease